MFMLGFALDFFRGIIFAILLGIMENRFFFEGPRKVGFKKGDYFLWRFKHYHLLLFLVLLSVSFPWSIVASGAPIGLIVYTWVITQVAMPFIQDLTWQSIENRDLEQDDWSNIGGFPLVGGWYVWYWASLIIVLTMLALGVPLFSALRIVPL